MSIRSARGTTGTRGGVRVLDGPALRRPSGGFGIEAYGVLLIRRETNPSDQLVTGGTAITCWGRRRALSRGRRRSPDHGGRHDDVEGKRRLPHRVLMVMAETDAPWRCPSASSRDRGGPPARTPATICTGFSRWRPSGCAVRSGRPRGRNGAGHSAAVPTMGRPGMGRTLVLGCAAACLLAPPVWAQGPSPAPIASVRRARRAWGSGRSRRNSELLRSGGSERSLWAAEARGLCCVEPRRLPGDGAPDGGSCRRVGGRGWRGEVRSRAGDHTLWGLPRSELVRASGPIFC